MSTSASLTNFNSGRDIAYHSLTHIPVHFINNTNNFIFKFFEFSWPSLHDIHTASVCGIPAGRCHLSYSLPNLAAIMLLCAQFDFRLFSPCDDYNWLCRSRNLIPLDFFLCRDKLTPMKINHDHRRISLPSFYPIIKVSRSRIYGSIYDYITEL